MGEGGGGRGFIVCGMSRNLEGSRIYERAGSRARRGSGERGEAVGEEDAIAKIGFLLGADEVL